MALRGIIGAIEGMPTPPFMGIPWVFQRGPVEITGWRIAEGWGLYSREAGEFAVLRECCECWAVLYLRGEYAAGNWLRWLRECSESKNERGA
jgi:hypothetical protein